MIAKTRYFKRGDSFESKILPVILGVLFLALIGFLIISNFRINKKRAELQSQAERLKKEIELLEEKKEKLETGILESETEDYLRKQAEILGLKKPGEEVVVVLPEKEKKEEETESEKSFWQKLLEKFGF